MLNRFEQFCSAISAIHRDIQKIERDEMEKYGFKGAYAQYLTILRRHPEGITAAQLCELSDKDKSAVSRAVSEMMEKGLLARSGGERAYRAALVLTQEGEAAAEFVCRRAEQAVEAVGNGLSDAARANFYEALDLIASNLQKVSRDGIPGGKE